MPSKIVELEGKIDIKKLIPGLDFQSHHMRQFSDGRQHERLLMGRSSRTGLRVGAHEVWARRRRRQGCGGRGGAAGRGIGKGHEFRQNAELSPRILGTLIR